MQDSGNSRHTINSRGYVLDRTEISVIKIIIQRLQFRLWTLQRVKIIAQIQLINWSTNLEWLMKILEYFIIFILSVTFYLLFYTKY